MNQPTTHTPGPWSDRNGRIFQTDRPELTIANVGRSFDGYYSPSNSRLIAAAPDLLAQLQNLVTCFERFEDNHTALVMDDARAAIVKAIGGLA